MDIKDHLKDMAGLNLKAVGSIENKFFRMRDSMNNQLLAIILIVIIAFSNSCGIAAKVRARNDMEDSKAAYKRCLQQNPDDPSKCEALKRAFEADLKAYRETKKGVGPGHTISIDQD